MCSIPGCSQPRGGGRYSASFTTLCAKHRQRDRRHGDPLQEPVLAVHISPYLGSLRRRCALFPEAAAWRALEARWEGLVKTSRDMLTVYEAGTPAIRWDVEAAMEIVNVARGATPQAAWEAAVSTVMMREAEPRRFASERSFRTQLGRRVRQLVASNRGSYWNPQEGRFKLVYRDPSPRAAMAVGDLLAETFGVAGVYLARQDALEADAIAAERTAFYTALREVAPG
jgi:hypothetical protein